MLKLILLEATFAIHFALIAVVIGRIIPPLSIDHGNISSFASDYVTEKYDPSLDPSEYDSVEYSEDEFIDPVKSAKFSLTDVTFAKKVIDEPTSYSVKEAHIETLPLVDENEPEEVIAKPDSSPVEKAQSLFEPLPKTRAVPDAQPDIKSDTEEEITEDLSSSVKISAFNAKLPNNEGNPEEVAVKIPRTTTTTKATKPTTDASNTEEVSADNVSCSHEKAYTGDKKDAEEVIVKDVSDETIPFDSVNDTKKVVADAVSFPFNKTGAYDSLEAAVTETQPFAGENYGTETLHYGKDNVEYRYMYDDDPLSYKIITNPPFHYAQNLLVK